MCALLLSGTVDQAQAPQDAGPPPVDRPDRLLRVQQLAFLAYPELRDVPVQMRVTDTANGAVVTVGRAELDRKDLLALSRPREALLVAEGRLMRPTR